MGLSVCTCPVIALLQHLKVSREVLNREANEGEETLCQVLMSFSFYFKCTLRLLHPWPWLVGNLIETNVVVKHVQLVYHSNDILHILYLLYSTVSLVRLVDLTFWGGYSKSRIA